MQDKIQFVKEYFDHTDTYITDNLVIGLRSKLLLKALPKIENKEILDIGCGNGENTLQFIENNKITYLDISNNMLDIVRRRITEKHLFNAEFINLDFESFNPHKKYDFLFLIGVLAHIDSIRKTFSQLSELSKDDGIIILQYTDPKNLISILIRIIGFLKMIVGKKHGYKINYYSTGEIHKNLDVYGLKSFKKVSFWPALPGFKLLPVHIRKFIYYEFLNSRMLQPLGGEIILFVSKSKV